MSIKLKVKAASLAAEQRIIRGYIRAQKAAARRAKEAYTRALAQHVVGQNFTSDVPANPVLATACAATHVLANLNRESLYEHCRGLAPLSRAACLALAALRGTPYSKAEAFTWHNEPDWAAVEANVSKFLVGDRRLAMQRYAEWRAAAAAHATTFRTMRAQRHALHTNRRTARKARSNAPATP